MDRSMPYCVVEKHLQKLRASIVIKEMESQMNTINICRWGLKAFMSITGAAMKEHNRDAMADFLDDGGCESILNLMSMHGGTDAHIAAEACLVISILCWSLKEMREFLGEIGACEMVLYVCSMHVGDEGVSEQGSSAIGLLGRDNKNSFKIAEADGCDIVAQMGNFGFNLRSKRCIQVAANVCYAFVPMCEASNCGRLIECGACALVIELTKQHVKDEHFAIAAVKALCALSSLNLVLREELGKVGACEYILDLIIHHQSRSLLQDACETVMHLSLNPSNTTVLGECGACEMLVEAFRTTLSENEVGCEVCTGGMLNMATYGIAAKQNRFRLIDAGAVVELKRVKVQSMRTRENIAQLFQLLGADGTHHHVPGDSRNRVHSRNTSGSSLSSLVSIIHGSEMKGDTVPLQVEVHHTIEVVDPQSSTYNANIANSDGNTTSSSRRSSRGSVESPRGTPHKPLHYMHTTVNNTGGGIATTEVDEEVYEGEYVARFRADSHHEI